MPSHTEQDPPLPWSAFFDELDQAISEPIELHCIGGFVVSLLYGLPRPTCFMALVRLRLRRSCPLPRSKRTSDSRPAPFLRQRLHWGLDQPFPIPFQAQIPALLIARELWWDLSCRTGPSRLNKPVCHLRRCKSAGYPAAL